MRNRFLPLLLITVFGLQAQDDAPAVRTFNLEQAQQYALEHNYTLRNEQFEIEKAQKTIRETAARYFPQVSASYDLTRNMIIQPIAFPTDQTFPGVPEPPPGTPAPENDFEYFALGGGDWQNTWGISANWNIGNYSNFLAKKASEVLKETRNLEKEEAEVNVRAEVAKAFYNVLVLDENVDLLEQNLGSLQENLYETRQLFQNGFVEEQDVDQIELLVSNMDNSLQNAKRQQVLARQLLKFQMGIPLEEEIDIEGELEEYMTRVEEELLGIRDQNLQFEEHVGFRKIKTQYRASVLQLKNEKADRYPTLSVGTNYSNLFVTNDFSQPFFNTYWGPGWTITGSLRWQLFTGLAREAQIQKAQIDVQRAEMNKQFTESQLKLDYERAKSDFLFALENYRNAKKNMGISKRIRDKTRLKYKEGISSSLDLTQAENQFIDTQGNYIQALQNLLHAKEELDQARGK